MNVIELLQGQLTDSVLDSLTKQVGGDDTAKTRAAANGIFSTLLTGLSKNASTPEGLSSLAGALDRDHDGSIMDDLMGLVTGSGQAVSSRAGNGAGILRHILGQKEDNASEMISQMSGLGKSSTTALMAKLAPMVMGALGQQKRQQGLDAGGLMSLLSSTVKSAPQSQAEMSLIEKFIDQDGDGSIMDDLMRMGGGMLGKLFK